MNNQYQIRVHSGSLRGQAFLINKNEFKVGRDPSCDIVLSENAVSRVHLIIYPQAYNAIVLVDNNSTNGTTVNNVQVTAPTQITENDVIMLGGEVALVLEKVPEVQSQQPMNQPPYYGQQVPGYVPPVQQGQPVPPVMPDYSHSQDPFHAPYPQPDMGGLPNYQGIPNQGPMTPPEHAAPVESSGFENAAEPLDSSYPQTPPVSNYPSAYPQDMAANQPVPGYSGPQSVYPPMSQPAPSAYPGQPPYGSSAYPNDPYSGQQGYGYNPNPVSQYPASGWGQAPAGVPQSPYNPNQPNYSQSAPVYGQQPPYGYPPQNQGYYGNQPYYGGQQQPGYDADYGNYAAEAEQPQNSKKRLLIILGIILFVILALIGFIIYIDTNYLWCKVFPFLWSPEACAVYP